MKKKLTAFIIASMMILSLCACGDSADSTSGASKKSSSSSQTEETTSSEASSTQDSANATDSGEETYIDGTELFSELSKYEFTFASGAGGWETTMTIDAHATVKGSYHDSEMGETGDDYPNGTVYCSDFETTLTDPIVESDYAYKLTTATDIICEKDYDTEEIIDGVKYIYTAPYGINYNTIHIYMKGAPVSELPEEFLDWMYLSGALDKSDTELPFIGLYVEDPDNEDGGYGWSSYAL